MQKKWSLSEQMSLDKKQFENQSCTRKSNEKSSMTFLPSNQCMNNDMIVDSGTTAHITNKHKWMKNVRQIQMDDITIANDTKLKVKS